MILCLCLSQVGVLSKRLDRSRWFWHGYRPIRLLHCQYSGLCYITENYRATYIKITMIKFKKKQIYQNFSSHTRLQFFGNFKKRHYGMAYFSKVRHHSRKISVFVFCGISWNCVCGASRIKMYIKVPHWNRHSVSACSRSGSCKRNLPNGLVPREPMHRCDAFNTDW